jgi:PLP dependent protein
MERMSTTVTNLQAIKTRMNKVGSAELVAVSKTFAPEAIRPVLLAGHRIFGENRVQEAKSKWPKLREEFDGIELHLIGPLQSNKAADAVALFDVIETIDRPKIAQAVKAEMEKQQRNISVLLQINTGDESQKAGINMAEANTFIAECKSLFGPQLKGLMCIPPVAEDPTPHFAALAEMARAQHLPQLSMGMSADFETAIVQGATHIRIGSAIFGAR